MKHRKEVVITQITAPKGELLWVVYLGADDQPQYVLTSKPLRDMYFLYEVQGNSLKWVGKNRDPTALEQTYIK